jgi:hypothetical protein
MLVVPGGLDDLLGDTERVLAVVERVTVQVVREIVKAKARDLYDPSVNLMHPVKEFGLIWISAILCFGAILVIEVEFLVHLGIPVLVGRMPRKTTLLEVVLRDCLLEDVEARCSATDLDLDDLMWGVVDRRKLVDPRSPHTCEVLPIDDRLGSLLEVERLAFFKDRLDVDQRDAKWHPRLGLFRVPRLDGSKIVLVTKCYDGFDALLGEDFNDFLLVE